MFYKLQVWHLSPHKTIFIKLFILENNVVYYPYTYIYTSLFLQATNSKHHFFISFFDLVRLQPTPLSTSSSTSASLSFLPFLCLSLHFFYHEILLSFFWLQFIYYLLWKINALDYKSLTMAVITNGCHGRIENNKELMHNTFLCSVDNKYDFFSFFVKWSLLFFIKIVNLVGMVAQQWINGGFDCSDYDNSDQS